MSFRSFLPKKNEPGLITDYSFNFDNFLKADTFDLSKIQLIAHSTYGIEKPRATAIREAVAKVLLHLINHSMEEKINHAEAFPYEARLQNKTVTQKQATVKVFNQDCLQVARTFHEKYPGKVAVLNMANRQTVGGGVFKGAFAQEEYLMCTTTLVGSLLDYAWKHHKTNPVKSDHVFYEENSFEATTVLYSKNRVIRAKNSSSFKFTQLPTEQQFDINIISSAALQFDPSIGTHFEKVLEDGKLTIVQYDPDYARKLLLTAIYKQIQVAIEHDNKAIVLSAFGCGAFRNDPTFIAKLYRKILCLPEFFGKIEAHFAILDNDQTQNCQAFLDVFKEPLTPSLAPVQPSSSSQTLFKTSETEKNASTESKYSATPKQNK